jgi:hypothetical protein
MDRQAGFAIDTVCRLDHVVLHVAANAVLWTKERNQVDVGMLVQKISGVMKTVIDGSLVADESDACAFEQRRAIFK